MVKTLIIDDDGDFVFAVQAVLGRAGDEVASA
jgi:hypothetical protein